MVRRCFGPILKVFLCLKSIYLMATFNERLLLYQQRPDAQKFTKKQLHRLHNAIAWVFNRNAPPGYIHTYTHTQDGWATILVRNYPEKFTPTIDGLINKLHERLMGQQQPRQRQRIPGKQKPVWRVPSTSK